MALPDLTDLKVNDTYQRLLQISSSGDIVDGTGSLFIPPNAISASYAISSSHEIIKEISSSYADTASFAQSGDGIFSGSFSGSYVGDGSQLTNLPTQDPFPFTGDAVITGSLEVTGDSITHKGIKSVIGSSYTGDEDATDRLVTFKFLGNCSFTLPRESGGQIYEKGVEIQVMNIGAGPLTCSAQHPSVTIIEEGVGTVTGPSFSGSLASKQIGIFKKVSGTTSPIWSFYKSTPTTASYASYAITSSYALSSGGVGGLWTASSGQITRDSDVSITGSLYMKGDIIPDTRFVYDLGSLGKSWRNLFVQHHSIQFVSESNSIASIGATSDGTVTISGSAFKCEGLFNSGSITSTGSINNDGMLTTTTISCSGMFCSGDMTGMNQVTSDTGSFSVIEGNSPLTISSSLLTIKGGVQNLSCCHISHCITASIFSGSYEGDGSQLIGIESSSYATTASYALTALSASYATTASYVEASNIVQPFTNITASGNISSSGLITGETLEVMGTADFSGSTTFAGGTTFNQGAAFDDGEFTMGTDGRFSYGDWIQSVAETSIDCRFKNIITLVPARVPAPWTVTSIHHAIEGQPLILLFDDFGTGVTATIQDNANINLNGTTDFIMNGGDTLTLIASSTSNTWYETGRMVR